MTAAGDVPAKIKNVLNAQIQIFALCIAGNLDPITKSTHGPVSPARSAILRDMLIQRMGEVGLAIDVSPSEGIGKIVIANVGVRERRSVVVQYSMTCEYFELAGLSIACQRKQEREGEQHGRMVDEWHHRMVDEWHHRHRSEFDR